jgi:hypothetical protein
VKDTQAERLAYLILDLACALRDDGPEDTAQLATHILTTATPTQALAVAAALIDIDRPVNRWWQQGLAGLRKPRPGCGTHAAFNRHIKAGMMRSEVDDECLAAERIYQRDRARRRRQAAAQREAAA